MAAITIREALEIVDFYPKASWASKSTIFNITATVGRIPTDLPTIDKCVLTPMAASEAMEDSQAATSSIVVEAITTIYSNTVTCLHISYPYTTIHLATTGLNENGESTAKSTNVVKLSEPIVLDYWPAVELYSLSS